MEELFWGDAGIALSIFGSGLAAEEVDPELFTDQSKKVAVPRIKDDRGQLAIWRAAGFQLLERKRSMSAAAAVSRRSSRTRPSNLLRPREVRQDQGRGTSTRGLAVHPPGGLPLGQAQPARLLRARRDRGQWHGRPGCVLNLPDAPLSGASTSPLTLTEFCRGGHRL